MRLISALMLLLPLAAFGAEEPAKPWSGTAALGILATSGNSDTTNANLAVGVNRDQKRWHHSAAFAAAKADSNGATTAQRYKAGYEARYDFTEHDYLFALVNYEKDKFSGYEQQLSEAVGYGRRLINDKRQVLNVQAGAGFKQSDLREVRSATEPFDILVPARSESGAILRLGGDYALHISETAKFTQTAVAELNSDNKYIETVSAIKATLVDRLGLVLSYTIKNNSDVPAGSEKTDTFTAISLEYGF